MIDLNLNDGVEAGYRFGTMFSEGTGADLLANPDGQHWVHDGAGSAQFMSPLQAELSLPRLAGVATLDPASGGSVSSSLWGAGEVTSKLYTYIDVPYLAPPTGELGLLLNPNTQLIATIDLAITITDAGLLGGLYTAASASAYIDSRAIDRPAEFEESGRYWASTGQDELAESWEHSTSLYTTMTNRSDHVLDYAISMTVSTAVIAVPEPSTSALLAGGLGLLGVWARRRRRHASAK